METEYVTHYYSPLGRLTLCSDGAYLTGVHFDERQRAQTARDGSGVPVLRQTARWLDLYFGGGIPDFTPPVRLITTPFCAEVCGILAAIPYGETTTYGAIAGILCARRGGRRMSAQAVGGAVGRNPVAIVIPCHRVIGAGGAMVGYGGGLERKTALLALEKEVVRKTENEKGLMK